MLYPAPICPQLVIQGSAQTLPPQRPSLTTSAPPVPGVLHHVALCPWVLCNFQVPETICSFILFFGSLSQV